MSTSTLHFTSFICRKATTWDRRLYFPSEGRRAQDFFALKIRGLRPCMNPRTWVPKASTLPLDHRRRLLPYVVWPKVSYKRYHFGENFTEYEMCVFITSTSYTFLNLRVIRRDMAKMYIGLCSCEILMNLEFSWHIFEKNITYRISWKSVQWEAELFTRKRSDGHDEADGRL